MPAKVMLEVTSGPMQGRVFCFDSHDTFVVGRHRDCHAGLGADRAVSRHHFILETNPPDVRVRDLGSRNGTFINGKKYGGRSANESAVDVAARVFPEIDVRHGDVITVGKTTIQVKVEIPLSCSRCGGEISEAKPARVQQAEKQLLCDSCRHFVRWPAQTVSVRGIVCSRCGKDVSDEVGDRPVGQYVCRECQRAVLNDGGQLRRLMQQAARRQDGGQRPVIEGYEIGELLGQGGMGAVYRATRKRDGHRVAVKILLAKIMVNETQRRTFLREIEVTRQLAHPNIVRLLESDSAGSTFYFVMEYCNGGSLDQWLHRQGGRLPVSGTPRIMLQCLEGLEHAHRQGFVHRDLKPQNILLVGPAEKPTVKISDFGLAKNFEAAGLSGMTATGSFGGTYHCMPREQLTDFKRARPVSDVWSIAATFYHLLTGCYPRDFDGNRDPIEIVLRDEPVPIRGRDSSLPGPVAEVIDRALSWSPVYVTLSAEEFRAALARACGRNGRPSSG